MRRMRMPPSDPVPGLAELPLHILLTLGDGPLHGYAIGQRVQEESGGRLDPTTGALYQALRRLTEEDLVTPVAAPDAVDPRRKYFAITRLGRRAVAQEAQRLAGLVRAARQRGLYPGRA
jgi:DNA-binding PadR family transcriptional regulator